MSRLAEARLAGMVLTRLPVGNIAGSPPPLARCLWAFPLVGAVVGALMGVVFSAADWLGLPLLAAALLAVATATLATGGLHEDGLADTADGFGGGQTVARKLEIMQDSRIGSFGVLALIFTLALTASAIATAGTFLTFIAISAASRTAMLLPMIWLKPARAEGLGHGAQAEADAPAFAALLLTLLLILFAGQILTLVAMIATALIVRHLAQRQIGGQTGDVLGATQKLAECTGWLTAAALAG